MAAAATTFLASRVKLRNGHTMPQIQLGLYMVSSSEARQVVTAALAVGYRGFDCAQMYHNERQAGAALRAALAESHQGGGGGASGSSSGHRSSRPELPPLAREDIFYTSKLAQNSTSYDAVRASIRKSVAACGLGYIDLFLLHSPYGGREARLTSWRAVEDAIDAGEIRSGGVSNYGVAHIEELMRAARIPPAVNQIESHPFNPRSDIRDACARHGILVEAYAPLVRGMRMKHPTIRSLSSRYGCSPAQLLVRWSLQHGMVPLPKSVDQKRMIENADVDNICISDADMAVLDGLDEHLVTDCPVCFKHATPRCGARGHFDRCAEHLNFYNPRDGCVKCKGQAKRTERKEREERRSLNEQLALRDDTVWAATTTRKEAGEAHRSATTSTEPATCPGHHSDSLTRINENYQKGILAASHSGKIKDAKGL
ncbi:aldo-keto reductase [Niveomyces insectorum RCEF 264]|uniref:Aldo-keto reductase n=1 Tax=Niveomyces insectorum RCEF 264 TaxID=1081102 RepID=A0A167YPG5_9HYPO|nr:aldo-keto reductase [Niveomyces insectorum RCEF 264]